MAELRPEQVTRYARHLILDGVGRDGQLRLLGGSVAVRGQGVAEEEAAVYLAAAGVGRLGLDAALGERLGDRLGRMNPDVSLATDGPWDVTLDGIEPATRLGGAQAALRALVTLTGAGPAREGA